MMATRKGLVKKTPLEAYSRPKKRRHHRHQAPRGDELVDVAITKPGDEVVLATAAAWRSASARPTPARWAATPAA
jgi:DNA gyrase subunit A